MTTETNAERLARIAATDRYMFDRAGRHVSIRFPDFDWLIQQTEQAQQAKIAVMHWEKTSLDFAKENARLREALQSACNSLGADIEDYL